MRLEKYLYEFMTQWIIIDQFQSPNNLVLEIFNSNIKHFPEASGSDYCEAFNAYGDKYIFMANEDKIENDIYGILFFKAGVEQGDEFKSVGEGLYKGKVFAGVLSSLRDLVRTKDVKKFYFSSDDKKLINFYNKSIKLIENRFPEYKLDEIKTQGQRTFWVYKKS